MDQDTRARRSFSPIWIALILLALIFVGGFVLVFRTDTQYAPGYTEAAFESIGLGDSKKRVLDVLGPPLSRASATPFITWLYSDASHPGYGEDGGVRGTFTEFTFGVDGRVRSVFGQIETVVSDGLLSRQTSVSLGENSLGISRAETETLKGKTQAEVEGLYGKPRYRQRHLATEYLIYSRSPSGSHYHLRHIGVDANGEVVEKRKYRYWD